MMKKIKVPVTSMETFALEDTKMEFSHAGRQFYSFFYFCYN